MYSYENIISKFIDKHGNKYDYSYVDYNNMKTKIKIICPIHGEFLQTPTEHIKGGCKRCHSTRLTTSEVKARFISKHGDKYNYSHVIYIKNDKAVKIFCNTCNQFFFQKPIIHWSGGGCTKCSYKKKRISWKKDIKFFQKKFNNKYCYKYNPEIDKKIYIFCPSHGWFTSLIGNHRKGIGCPKCSNTRTLSKGATKIKKFLESNQISFELEKRFPDCQNDKTSYSLPFDFYLSDKNILIEFDGELHYKNISFFGGKEELKKIQDRDKIKTDYCKINHIKLIRIPYWNFDKIEKILKGEICQI